MRINSFLRWTLLFLIAVLLSACDLAFLFPDEDVAEATGEIFEIRNNNVPYFDEEDYSYADEKGPFTELSPLDELGRVGVCWGLFDYDHMPTYDREQLDTEPTGWHQKKYDTSIVPGGWLYARAHLLAFQLSGYQDNPQNLMTGTRDFNNEGMLPFENMVADHLREENEHQVLYRVTPDFGEDNLLAYGVLIESDCLDCDDSADFCVFIKNQQPGVMLDYSTGENWLSSALPPVQEEEVSPEDATYILNTNTMRFHELDCSGAPSPDSQNYKLTDMSYDEAVEAGYTPCGICKPQPPEQIPEITMLNYVTLKDAYILSMPA